MVLPNYRKDRFLSDPASEYLFGVMKALEAEIIARPSETPTEALTKMMWFGSSAIEADFVDGSAVVTDAARFTQPVAKNESSPSQETIQ